VLDELQCYILPLPVEATIVELGQKRNILCEDVVIVSVVGHILVVGFTAK
jgi:hypothetical protein